MKTALMLFLILILPASFHTGCNRLFGWNIHAPGILSQGFRNQAGFMDERVALYAPPHVKIYVSTDRGSKLADPQTFYVGEAFYPMLLEAFQDAFSEFILIEAEPSEALLRRYGIPYLVAVRIKDFRNRVTLKGQALVLRTEVAVYDSSMNLLAFFEAQGASDAEKVFAKRGGPEVNLNAALERNLLVTVQQLQDLFREEGFKR